MPGAYYKQQSRWVSAFRRHLASAEAETVSQLVDWLVAKLSDAHPERGLVELRWVYANADGSDASRTLWIRDPDRDSRQ